MSFFARACIAALRQIPAINAEIRGDEIVYKHFVHLGVAVGTRRGWWCPSCTTPTRLSFAEIEREIERLAGLARTGKLTIDDLSGGHSRSATAASTARSSRTPILNPPQWWHPRHAPRSRSGRWWWPTRSSSGR